IYFTPDLARHIEELPPRLKDAILLNTMGYSRWESARILHCSPKRFKCLLADARARLKVVLNSPICFRRPAIQPILAMVSENEGRARAVMLQTHSGLFKPNSASEVIPLVN